MQILDYSNSQVVTLNVGRARIQTGTFRLIHVIELAVYEKKIDEIASVVNSKIAKDDPLYPFLAHEIAHIENHLNRLKPKIKVQRSLDFLGKTWKWIAGSPDHEDFEILTEKINNVLENNNKQVVVNKIVLERMNKLSNITNQVMKIVQTSDRLQNQVALSIKFKLEIIKEEITNIEYAIHWAKAGLINSFILDDRELNIIKEYFEENKIPYINIEEAIELANVKIASSNSSIIYIVGIPITNINQCNMLLIKPIKIKNVINKIDYENVLTCGNRVYGIRQKCNSFNSFNICNRNNLVELKEDECIPRLLRSQQPSCTRTTGLHVPAIEEISPGVLFLNQYTGSILINGDATNLTGTFIIHFANATITVGSKNFTAREISSYKPLPAILQPSSILSTYEEILTLEAMKELHVNNTEEIKLLRTRNQLGLLTNCSLSSLAIVAIIVIVIVKIRCKRKPESSTTSITPISVHIPSTSGTEKAPEGAEFPEPPRITSVNKIPYF